MTDGPRIAHASDVALGDAKTLRTVSKGRLARLGEATDLQIADGEPDIRGWTVKGPADNRVGKVAELLVDTGTMKLRYLEVQLDESVAETVARLGGETDSRIEPSRYALVPIGIARLDRAHDRVYLSARAADLIGLPEAERQALSREHERAIVRGYGLGGREAAPMPAARDADDRDDETLDPFYETPHFDESSFFGPRRRAGESSTYVIPSIQRGTNPKS